MEREIFIIPNKDILDAEVYYEKLKKGEHHSDEALDFLVAHNCLDMSKSYKQFPPMLVASFGSICICLDGKDHFNTIFLPECITKEQMEWMIARKEFWEELKYSLLLQILNDDCEEVFSISNLKNINILYEQLAFCFENYQRKGDIKR